MGNMIRNKVLKPIRHFNVESRAEKVISRDKPVMAPKYQSNIEDMERVLKKNPNILKEINEKNTSLYDRLRDVYVSSQDIVPETPISSSTNPKRPLPVDKSTVNSFEYGIQEPDIITPGKTTLRLALKFITEHNLKPEIANVDYISKTYNLKPETTEDILHYFKAYEIFIPSNLQTNPVFAKAIDEYTTLKLETSKQLQEQEKEKNERGSNITKDEMIKHESKI